MVKNNKNGAIELLRFLFIIPITVIHWNWQLMPFGNGTFFPSGVMAVEFFFILSGFYMVVSSRKDIINTDSGAGEKTLKFVWHKYVAMFPYYIVAIAFGFIMINWANKSGLTQMANNFVSTIWEVIPLQVFNYNAFTPTGVAWYLSAMYLSMFILYPILLKRRDLYLNVIAPLLALFIYGQISFKYGVSFVIMEPLIGPLTAGFLRGIAGISLGAFLYRLTEMGANIKLSRLATGILSLIEVLFYVLIFFLMSRLENGQSDFVQILLIFIALTITLSNKTISARLLSCRITTFLGKISMLVYLNHFALARYVMPLYIGRTSNVNLYVIYCFAVVIQVSLCLLIGNIGKWLWNFCTHKLKKIFLT
ncbi:MAG: putative acyltransferase [Erysipelotrichaceae bacterium]|nr:MAG: hypothetical protein FD179_948 [Erysipelotrichaceae bacterium]TXT18480.1 MAG: putative acyltransferase [Erysipelotrichaceae bacterium]